ncbi:hypothetical protein [Membranihabitans maritimus]|uniref:hypothetical protein n=1 Tax=Membranihabitans maritimus TaxID=2904244 RepID=UPI001F3F84DF|nr:hypothetical protein [Membranihabitans maritimus]
MEELTAKVLKKAQRKAGKESIKITKALELPYYVVKKDYLYLIQPDGVEKRIKKAAFGIRKVDVKKIKIKNDRQKA